MMRPVLLDRSEHAVAENLATALAAFQAEAPRIGKGNVANAGTYSYKYADLADINEVVLPLLGKHGLSFSAKPTIVDNRFVLAYTLRHAAGDHDDGIYPLPDPTKVSAQQIGSAISYARRYTLLAVTGIAPGGEDDDGAQAAPASREPVETYESWDPIEQEELREGYERDIETARSVEELNSIAATISVAKKNRKISPATSDRLLKTWSARRGEMNGAAEPATDQEPATVPPASDGPPSRRQQQLDRMTARVEARKEATDGPAR